MDGTRLAPIANSSAPPVASGCGPSVIWPANSRSAATDQPRRSPSILLSPIDAPPRAPTGRSPPRQSREPANPGIGPRHAVPQQHLWPHFRLTHHILEDAQPKISTLRSWKLLLVRATDRSLDYFLDQGTPGAGVLLPGFGHRRRVRLGRRPPWRGKADRAACRHVALLT